MSYMLYIVRHAIAEDVSATGRDEDRRLTAEGIAKFERALAGLRKLGVSPEAVFASPLCRTRETAELLCKALAPGVVPALLPALAPGGAAEAVLDGLRTGQGTSSVALVGHEPDLGELAARLIAGRRASGALAFKKGGVAALEVASLPPSSGTLHWFLTPKQLRALG
jgi:phosphohistidine phosphatase